MIGHKPAAPFPRDEWIIGDGRGGDGRFRSYIVHTVPPRFIARVVNIDGEGRPIAAEGTVALEAGIRYQARLNQILCEFAWIDEPDAKDVTQCLEAAADALESYDDSLIE